jgi:hypothetical protein
MEWRSFVNTVRNLQVLPKERNLFSNSAPGRPRFNAKKIYVEFVVVKMAIEHGLPLTVIIPQMLHFYLKKGWYGADHSGRTV